MELFNYTKIHIERQKLKLLYPNLPEDLFCVTKSYLKVDLCDVYPYRGCSDEHCKYCVITCVECCGEGGCGACAYTCVITRREHPRFEPSWIQNWNDCSPNYTLNLNRKFP